MISDNSSAFEFMLLFSILFLVDVIAILLLLWYRPIRRRPALAALNIILLFWVPFGTVLGIYYLWKVGKQSIQAAESSQ